MKKRSSTLYWNEEAQEFQYRHEKPASRGKPVSKDREKILRQREEILRREEEDLRQRARILRERDEAILEEAVRQMERVSRQKKAETLYDILEVSPKASPEVIRGAFRGLAVKYHPDKNKQPNASMMFRRVKMAYDVLSDEEKKKEYDSRRK